MGGRLIKLTDRWVLVSFPGTYIILFYFYIVNNSQLAEYLFTHMLNIKMFTFSPIAENTYVLYNDFKNAIIIDPGCYFPEEREELQSFIEGEGLTVQKLINTHCHLDHIFGNKFVADTFTLPLHLHPKEKIMLERAPASGLMFNLPFDNFGGEMIFLEDGDTVKLDNDTLEVIFAPGHSPGHICFYCREQHFIISGDVLFKDNIGRTDLPGGNQEILLRSIRERLFVLPDEVVVHPGHGPDTTIGTEKRENPFVGES